MKKEDYKKLKFEFGGEYRIKKLPKDIAPTFFNKTFENRVGTVVKIVEKPYQNEMGVVLRIDNRCGIFGDNYKYLTFDNEDLFNLEKVDKSKSKKIQPTIEFDFGARITTLKLDKAEIKVKAHEDDTFDEEKGVLLCIAKLYGYSYEDIKKLVKNATEKVAYKYPLDTIVKVTDVGETYSTYESFVKKYANKEIKNYRLCDHPNTKEIYIVVARGMHEDIELIKTPIYVIKNIRGQIFVISEDGIEEI